MPQDMPLEGNKAGEGFYWEFARKVAEELLPQSDSENSQPMCSQVYTSSKFAKHMSGRFVCYLIIYKLFSLDFPFFRAKISFPVHYFETFDQNFSKIMQNGRTLFMLSTVGGF